MILQISKFVKNILESNLLFQFKIMDTCYLIDWFLCLVYKVIQPNFKVLQPIDLNICLKDELNAYFLIDSFPSGMLFYSYILLFTNFHLHDYK